MKIKLVSDLHLQHWQSPLFLENISNIEADVLVLAGDIVGFGALMYEESFSFMQGICAAFGKPVLYVPGNHEYYGSWPNLVQDMIFDMESAIPYLHWLRTGKGYEHNGIRFLGDTMWFKKPADSLLSSTFIDFHCIRNLNPWVYQEHRKFMDYLNSELKEGDVVVTHHAPSYLSVAPNYIGDKYNCFFISPDAEELILDKKPSAWLHGHVHDSFKYKIDKTQVVCNPLGYKMEKQQMVFDPNLLIEV